MNTPAFAKPPSHRLWPWKVLSGGMSTTSGSSVPMSAQPISSDVERWVAA